MDDEATADSTEPIWEQGFTCKECGEECAYVELYDTNVLSSSLQAWQGEGTCFIEFVGEVSFVVEPEEFKRLLVAYQRNDLNQVHEVFDLYAPFYCDVCEESYCLSHWEPRVVHFDDGFYDYETGTCPQGHTRVLND